MISKATFSSDGFPTSSFTYMQPLLIRRALDFVERQDGNSNIGYGLIGATIIVYSGLAVDTLIPDRCTVLIVFRFSMVTMATCYIAALL